MSTTLDVATKEVAGQSGLGDLPEWDLADLYPGRDSPELASALTDLAAAAVAFRARHQGRLRELSGAVLGEAVAQYEAPAGDRRPHHQLCRADAGGRCRRPRDRALCPDDA